MSEQLSWNRLRALLRNETVASYRIWLMVAAVNVGFMALAVLLGANDGEGVVYIGWFAAILTIWGTIIASFAFSEMHEKSHNIAYLTLPASALEKTLVPLLITTVVLVAFLLLVVALASLALEAINFATAGRSNAAFNPFDGAVWSIVAHYVVIQSLFFAGGAWFRRARWLFTALSILCVCAALFVVLWFALWLNGSAYLMGGDVVIEADMGYWYAQANPLVGAALEIGGRLLYFIALPVFCWYLAWLRVTEAEVSHGV